MDATSSESWGPGPAVVALGILALIGAITISAIFHYTSVDDALKFWSALAGLAGVVTGAFVSFFFTRATVQTARQSVETLQRTTSQARQQTTEATQLASKATQRAETSDHALTATFGLIHDDVLLEQVMKHPAVVKALELS